MRMMEIAPYVAQIKLQTYALLTHTHTLFSFLQSNYGTDSLLRKQHEKQNPPVPPIGHTRRKDNSIRPPSLLFRRYRSLTFYFTSSTSLGAITHNCTVAQRKAWMRMRSRHCLHIAHTHTALKMGIWRLKSEERKQIKGRGGKKVRYYSPPPLFLYFFFISCLFFSVPDETLVHWSPNSHIAVLSPVVRAREREYKINII
eukprot:gene8173-5702_t